MPEPLEKKNRAGTRYTRPPEIEACLEMLDALHSAERLRQFESYSRRSKDYVPSEALVHFLRKAWAAGARAEFEQIFRTLLRRVEHSLSSAISDRRMEGAAEIRDEVRGRFLEVITQDCNGKRGRLDFFEVRFDKALAAIRTSTLRKIGPAKVKTVPLERQNNDGTTEIPQEVEEAAAEFLSGDPAKINDPSFRSAMAAAIEALPQDQKQVITLLLKGFPIDSKEPGVMTIAQILKCDERTIRNRRDRAQRALRAILQEENAQ